MTAERRGLPVFPGAPDALTVGALLGVVYVGKRFYESAGVEDLAWVLGPTALLSGWLVGGRFAFEAGYGYVDTVLRFAIVPGCAGVNFLLVAIGVLASSLALGEARTGRRLARCLAAVAAAYVVTVIANAVRIALAVAWHVHQPDLGWLTAARWHRIEGVVVYVAALLVAHELASAWRRRREEVAA